MQAGHVRRSQKEIVEGGATVTRVVGTELIEQEPLVEEYMSEEVEHQVVRKPRRKATKKIVQEVEESSEEEVIVRKRSPRRAKRVVQQVRKSPRRRVEYVEESSSEEEVVQMRRPVVKQRVIPQPAKVQKIVVEEPQQKVTKAKKEVIKVPVQTTRTEEYQEEVNIETEADRRLEKELETKLKVRGQDLVSKQAEIQQLAALLEQKQREHSACRHEIEECDHNLKAVKAKPKTQMVTKTRQVPHTEYHEKKVRKVTTETPVAVENWRELARESLASTVVKQASPARSSVVITKSPVRKSVVSTTNPYLGEAVETRVIRKSTSPSRVVRTSTVGEKLYGSSMTLGGGSTITTQTLPGATYTTGSRTSQVIASPSRTSVVKKSGWNKY